MAGEGAVSTGINGVIDGIFNAIGVATKAIRDLVHSFAPDYYILILFGISVLGGWYINKKYPGLLNRYAIVGYGMIIFLLLRYV